MTCHPCTTPRPGSRPVRHVGIVGWDGGGVRAGDNGAAVRGAVLRVVRDDDARLLRVLHRLLDLHRLAARAPPHAALRAHVASAWCPAALFACLCDVYRDDDDDDDSVATTLLDFLLDGSLQTAEGHPLFLAYLLRFLRWWVDAGVPLAGDHAGAGDRASAAAAVPSVPVRRACHAVLFRLYRKVTRAVRHGLFPYAVGPLLRRLALCGFHRAMVDP